MQRVLLACVLVLVLGGYCAVGISRIRFDVDVTKLLPEDLPEAAGARVFMEHFLKRSQVLVLLEGTSAEAVEAATERVAGALEAKRELVQRVVWRRADDEVGAWAEFVAWSLLNQPEASMRAWMEGLSEARLAGTLGVYLEGLATSPFMADGLAGYDPLGLTGPLMKEMGGAGERSEFGSADGLFRVVYVDLKEALSDYREVAKQLGEVRELATVAAGGEVAVRLTGEPAFLAEISQSMEADMKGSALSTLVLTTLLVWVVFRRVRLLPLLALCLGLIFVLTLATCGLIMGSITALTVGFASILIGLSADYGVLLYEAYRVAGGDAREAVRQVRGGIFWAIATTAAVFLALMPLGFPGLSDLGLLVAVGVGIGGVVMVGVLPRLLGRWVPVKGGEVRGWSGLGRGWQVGCGVGVVVLVGCAAGLGVRGLPKVDAASGSIRPRGSEAYEGVERLEAKLGGGARALSVVVAADGEGAMVGRIAEARRVLEGLKGAGVVSGFALPEGFWPEAGRQGVNLGLAGEMVRAAGRLRAGVMEAGFTEEAWGLAEGVLGCWERWGREGAPGLLEGAGARWLVERVVSLREDGGCALLGEVRLGKGVEIGAVTQALPEGCYLAGGDVMTRTLDRYLEKGFTGISVLFAVITLVLLAFAFRAWRPFVLVVLCLGVSYAALLGLMAWLDLRWHAFTLPALLLSLGTGSDYFIHLILRMQGGATAAEARGELGPALVVCAGSSMLGFGSLVTASSSGLASMGVVCAAALGLNLVAALLVMPWLWERWFSGNAAAGLPGASGTLG